MMNICTYWNNFHDAQIQKIQPHANGDLTIFIRKPIFNSDLITYKNLILNLQNCDLFTYERYVSADMSTTYDRYANIESLSPPITILSCRKKADYIEIDDICGLILLRYEHLTISRKNDI